MSLKYMGVPDFCRHFHSEDRCEICKLEKQVKQLQSELAAERAKRCPHEVAREFSEKEGGVE